MSRLPILPDITPAELLEINRPAQYLGGELNSVVKDEAAIDFRFALCFPDTYEVGMSNLGVACLYDLVNQRPDMLAERAYVPWHDMQREMRARGVRNY
ncbi:MAG: B12-binding domain-containing radical SAM protein, partial [Deltaproteobacteria bacterium]|nr:B12-binding domain-containing radical SAM protein [Deltaproteobacteria bacterium]